MCIITCVCMINICISVVSCGVCESCMSGIDVVCGWCMCSVWMLYVW